MSTEKKFYEAVFEGKYETICGIMEGFLLGKDKAWEWFPSKNFDIETETFTEAFLEWASLKSKLHHIIIEKDFINTLTESLKKHPEMKYAGESYIKSVREIESATFEFKSKSYAKKYGDEIQSILKELPASVKISDLSEELKEDKDAEGIELYAPAHDYEYRSHGKVTGNINDIIEFRKILNTHPLIEVTDIKLHLKK